MGESEIARLDFIKQLAIIAMFSDDELMGLFVLKGGSALDLIYRMSARASIDVDLSLPDDLPFSKEEAEERIRLALLSTFAVHGLVVFDVRILEAPPVVSPEFKDFWGGYTIDFKAIEVDKALQLGDDIEALRRNALQIGQKGKFRVDVSKHEYCEGKVPIDMEGFRIYAYTPAMILVEKLRAICQQSSSYADQLGRARTPRARDFIDIWMLVDRFAIDLTTPENLQLLRSVFDAKRVPMTLLAEIGVQRELHRADYPSVVNTVKVGMNLQGFDFYFDYVEALVQPLKSLWDV